jgi:hypothetical protein
MNIDLEVEGHHKLEHEHFIPKQNLHCFMMQYKSYTHQDHHYI